MPAQRLGQLVGLDDRGHVGDEDAARAQHACDGLDEQPRLGQVEDGAVDLLLLGEPLFHGPEADGQVRHFPHPHLNVRERAPREVFALLIRDDLALGPDRAQKR